MRGEGRVGGGVWSHGRGSDKQGGVKKVGHCTDRKGLGGQKNLEVGQKNKGGVEKVGYCTGTGKDRRGGVKKIWGG